MLCRIKQFIDESTTPAIKKWENLLHFLKILVISTKALNAINTTEKFINRKIGKRPPHSTSYKKVYG